MSIVPRLAGELRDRLAELDRERALVNAALVALDNAAPPRFAPGRRRETLDERIERALRDEPGIRASMLAEVEGVSVEAVLARLRVMEQHGYVSRDGLGWGLRTT